MTLEHPKANTIYPGCLVVLDGKDPGRVVLLDKSPRRMTTSDVFRYIHIGPQHIGVVIEVFPNSFVKLASRTWLVYFHPNFTVVEQTRLTRVSLSWKENQEGT